MQNEKQYIIPGGVIILEYLQSKGVDIFAPCGGHGTCGKCKIKLLAGSIAVSESDKALLGAAEINEGVRLACKAKTVSPVRISVDRGSADMKIMGAESASPVIKYDPSHRYAVALDLGTTTLAAALVDITEKKIKTVHTAINRQRVFGADVMTRMEAALSGKAEDLKRIIERDIADLAASFDLPSEIPLSDMVISGNTCMYHLLMEYDVSGLSRYPFIPVTLGGKTLIRDEVFSYETEKRNVFSKDCRITFVRGMSAFVGGDISSGITKLCADGPEENFFFIDIGTNAEMVLKKGNELFTASAAAGPALEGGNLHWGIAGIPGAISSARLSDDSKSVKVKTIDDAPPVGICGTGVIEIVSALLDGGILNKFGTFTERYIEDGFPLAAAPSGDIIDLNQDDIRQIQMAKAAIRAGEEMLLENAGVQASKLNKIYVSGGFGTLLNIKKAIRIGLFPAEFEEKAEVLGNTSLNGAVKILTGEVGETEWLDKMRIKQFDLAGDESFNDRYIECMNFDV